MSPQMSWMLMTVPLALRRRDMQDLRNQFQKYPGVWLSKNLLMLRSEFQVVRMSLKYVFSIPGVWLICFAGHSLSECKSFLAKFLLVKCTGVTTPWIEWFHGCCKTLLSWADLYFSIAMLLVCHNSEKILMPYNTTWQPVFPFLSLIRTFLQKSLFCHCSHWLSVASK